MDENIGFALRIFLTMVAFVFGLFIIVGTLDYFDTQTSCNRLSDYDYLVSMEGDFWNGYDCFILMEDGTKINSYDFSIADYKKPITKPK